MVAGVHIRHNYIFIPRLASDFPLRMTAYANDADGGMSDHNCQTVKRIMPFGSQPDRPVWRRWRRSLITTRPSDKRMNLWHWVLIGGTSYDFYRKTWHHSFIFVLFFSSYWNFNKAAPMLSRRHTSNGRYQLSRRLVSRWKWRWYCAYRPPYQASKALTWGNNALSLGQKNKK